MGFRLKYWQGRNVDQIGNEIYILCDLRLFKKVSVQKFHFFFSKFRLLDASRKSWLIIVHFLTFLPSQFRRYTHYMIYFWLILNFCEGDTRRSLPTYPVFAKKSAKTSRYATFNSRSYFETSLIQVRWWGLCVHFPMKRTENITLDLFSMKLKILQIISIPKRYFKRNAIKRSKIE